MGERDWIRRDGAREWILDASMSRPEEGAFCFCPIEGDIHGQYTIVTGMNMISGVPPGRLVAIVHPEGQAAAEAFCRQYAAQLGELETRWEAAREEVA